MAMPGLSTRARQIPVAETLAVMAKARAMRAEGRDVIALSIGEPDFPTPDNALPAAIAAVQRGETKYPPVDGMAALKAAIARKFQRDHGLDYAANEIMVSNGGKQSIFNALMATVDPGDEVVIPAPYWNAYPLITQFAGGTPVFVDCPEADGFKLRPDALAAAITPRTRWLILNFPNNPTGAACSADEMRALAEVMRAHPHVWIMCDDMYEHLVYGGFTHATMAQVASDLKDRVLTLSGVSKTYAMTGWRLGFAGGPAPLIKAMANMQGQATSGVCTLSQAAAAAVLDGPQDLVAQRAAEYEKRRNRMVDLLNAAPGLRCHKPEGAFYVFPNIGGCLGKTTPQGRRIETDGDFALALLEDQAVAVVQGSAFGMSPYIRISYAADPAALDEACRRIQLFCEGLG